MKPELVEIELTQFPVTPREHATIQEPVAIDSIDNSSDDESVKSWHSCLDRPARPMLPQHLRIAVQDDDVEEGVLTPPDILLCVWFVRSTLKKILKQAYSD